MKKLLVILFVLFFVTPAFSEPYMAWSQTTLSIPQLRDTIIQPWQKYVDIFDTKEECNSKIQEFAKEMGYVFKSGKDYAIVKININRSRAIMRFNCFPVGRGPR